jgi:hypothetical protein
MTITCLQAKLNSPEYSFMMFLKIAARERWISVREKYASTAFAFSRTHTTQYQKGF